MADNSPASTVQPPANEQPDTTSFPKTETEKQTWFQKFFNAFRRTKVSDKDTAKTHGLYNFLRHYAESVKILIQMVIGVILSIALVIDGIAFLFYVSSKPSTIVISPYNPLDIIAYGLFFSTGVDLAYMLFTPGPDEAIEPVMTGLAAAILLGIGNLGDISKLNMQQAEILFLAVAALAGLFATKKYLFDSLDEDKTDTKNKTQVAKQTDEVQK